MKGISPLLSAVLLIVIAVSASVIVSSWVSTLSEQHTATVRNQTQTRLGCQFADLFIRNATYNCGGNCAAGTSHNVTLYVTNSGKKTLRIEGIAIQNTTGAVTNFAIDPVSIAVGDTAQVSNASTLTCNGINRTIEDVIVSSSTCPDTAADRYPGSSVVFVSC